MKKRLLGLLLGVMLISVCVGCGAENTTTEPTETVETTATTQESTVEQTEETTATTTESTEQTTEVTEEASEEVETETETTEPMETVTPEPTEEPTPEPEPQAIYTYTDMSATMYAQQTGNVRDLPDTSGNKLGSLSTNDEIAISGQCNETGWYRFEYNGSVVFMCEESYVLLSGIIGNPLSCAENQKIQGRASNAIARLRLSPVLLFRYDRIADRVGKLIRFRAFYPFCFREGMQICCRFRRRGRLR